MRKQLCPAFIRQMDRKHYYKKAIGVADVEVTPRENASGGGAAPPAAAPKHAGFQHRRIRNGTLAVFFVLLLVLAGVFSAAHFAHIGILHSKSTVSSMPCNMRMAVAVEWGAWLPGRAYRACSMLASARPIAPPSMGPMRGGGGGVGGGPC